MSQAKVDRYKLEKANRKKIMAKEKAKRAAGKVCAWAVFLAIVGWAGYSGFSYYESKQPVKTIYTDLSGVSDYIESLNTEAE